MDLDFCDDGFRPRGVSRWIRNIFICQNLNSGLKTNKQRRAILRHLELSGTIWKHLEPYWKHLEPSEAISNHLETSEANCSNLELSGEWNPCRPRKWSQKLQLGPPSTRAGGQGDGSYTNSLKIHPRAHTHTDTSRPLKAVDWGFI